MSNQHHRKIQSFMRRCTRMSERQKQGLAFLDTYGLLLPLSPDPSPVRRGEPVMLVPSNETVGSMTWAFAEIFQNDAPVILEIGFGMGETLFECASKHPDKNFLGIEVHKPGIGSLLSDVNEAKLTNLRVYEGDAVEALQQAVEDNSLSEVYLFFPDPWPKRAHHKRRIVQPAFVELLARKLKLGGVFHMATDWEDYAHHMMEVMTSSQSFKNQYSKQEFAPDMGDRGLTKFEKRGKKLGHGVWDLLFVRI